MGRGSLVPLVFASICMLLPACGDDNPTKPTPPPAPKDQKANVLTDLEAAYNQRNIQKYDARLDDNFTFYFYSGDVGGPIPPSWDRATELFACSHMFDSHYGGHPITHIQLDLTFDPATLTWVAVQPDPNQYPGETWYATAIYYQFHFEAAPDLIFENKPGTKARFTVRNAGTDDAPRWRLVEMSDFGATVVPPSVSLARSPQ